MGRKGDGRSDSARTKVTAVQGRPEEQALADPARELPVVRRRASSRTPSRCCPTTTSPTRAAHRLRATSSATSRATAPLPIVAVDEPLYRRLPGLPDRDGGQVRVAALGRAGRARCSAGPTGTTRTGFYGAAEPGRGTRLAGAAAAARPRHPGRAAPDLRPARHDGRALRDGDRGPLRARDRRPRGAAQDRRLDGHRAPGAGPDPGALRAAAHAGLPAAGPDRRDSFFAQTVPSSEVPARLYLGDRRPGAEPEGHDAQGVARAHGRRRACLPRRRRAQEPREPGRPVHDGARLLQQPARAGRRAADPRGGGPEHRQGLRRRASASARAPGSSRTARPSRRSWS